MDYQAQDYQPYLQADSNELDQLKRVIIIYLQPAGRLEFLPGACCLSLGL